MARVSSDEAHLATAVQGIPVLLGLLANTAFKLALAAALGRGVFRAAVIVGLGIMRLAVGAALALTWA